MPVPRFVAVNVALARVIGTPTADRRLHRSLTNNLLGVDEHPRSEVLLTISCRSLLLSRFTTGPPSAPTPPFPTVTPRPGT